MESLTERILRIVEDELPKRSLGLSVLGVDVAWGNWPNPEGQGLKVCYAILFAVRTTGPNGEVLLGSQLPTTCAMTLNTLWPSEQEIRQNVEKGCDSLRNYLADQHAQQRLQGNSHSKGPIADILRDLLNPGNEQ